jgi:hypothetical protein
MSLVGPFTFIGGNDSAWNAGDTIDPGPGTLGTTTTLTGANTAFATAQNTFIYDLNYGNVVVDAPTPYYGHVDSTIMMGPGITESDLTFFRSNLTNSGYDDLGIIVAGAGTMIIEGELSNTSVGQIDFSNGSTMSLVGPFTFIGGNDSAWNAGDTIDPGPGTLGTMTTLTGANTAFATEQNTFIYDLNYGNVVVDAPVPYFGSVDSTIAMGVGIDASDLNFSSVVNNLAIAVVDGGTVQIEQELSYAAIQQIDFTDNIVLSEAQVLLIMNSDSIAAGTSSAPLVSASNTIVTETSGSTINLEGSTDSINMSLGGYLGIVTGTDDTVTIGNGLVDAIDSFASFSFIGSGDTFMAGAGDNISLSGSNDAVALGTAASADLLSGTNIAVDVSGGTLTYGTAVNDVTLFGLNDLALAADGSTLTVGGQLISVDLASGVLNLDTYASATLTGSNDEIIGAGNLTFGAGGSQLKLYGTNDSIIMLDGGEISLASGGNINIALNGGTLQASSSVTNITLTGENDTIIAGGDYDTLSGTSIVISEIGTVLSLGSGITDLTLLGDNGLGVVGSSDDFNLAPAGTLSLSGSSDEVFAGAGSELTLSGTSDAITMLDGGNVSLLAGASIGVSLNSGTLDAAIGVASISFAGDDDIISMSGGGLISITSGDSLTADISNSTIVLGNSVQSLALTGSNDTLSGGTGNQLVVEGTQNVLSLGTASNVSLSTDSVDVLNMSGSVLTIGNGAAGLLVGSNNSVSVAAGGYVEVSGNNNTVTGQIGSTVVLNAGDSGETIDMTDSTIQVGTSVSGVTLDGFINDITGAGASSVTQLDPTIQQLVSFFTENPNLTDAQIEVAESFPGYEALVSKYIGTVDLIAVPDNILAMLYGFSSFDLTADDIEASVFGEAATIQQDFAFGSENAPVPTDNLATVLDNLLPALEDSNTITQDMVTLALSELAASRIENEQAGGAGTPIYTPNVEQIIISDTAAKLALEAAEAPDNAKPGNEVEEVRLPGKPDPYKIVVTPTYPGGDQVLVKNEHGTFLDELLGDIDTYVGPVLNILALIPEPFQQEFILAASAVSLIQAGQDFASGDDLGGLFSALSASGAGLGALGQLGDLGTQADDALAEEFGTYLKDASNFGAGVDGVVNAIETGSVSGGVSSGLSALAAIGGAMQEFSKNIQFGINDPVLNTLGKELSNGATFAMGTDQLVYGAETTSITTAINGLFEAAGGAAVLQNDTTVQKFALLGGDLASAAEASDEAANGQGTVASDIFAALTSLIKAQQQYNALGGLSAIEQDIDTLWATYASSILGIASGGTAGSGSGAIDPSKYTKLTYGNGMAGGIELYDPSYATNSILIKGITALVRQDGNSSVFDVALHGYPDGFGDDPEAATDPTFYSAEQIYLTLMSPASGYVPGEAVQLYSCSTGGDPTDIASGNVAQQLADLLQVPVTAPSTYLDMNKYGMYQINSNLANPPPIFFIPLISGPGLYNSNSPGAGYWETFTPRSSDFYSGLHST